MPFDPDFTLHVLLPLAVHAYTVSGLPHSCESFDESGFDISKIEVDPARCRQMWQELEDLSARGMTSAARASDMLTAVMADSHTFGFVATGTFKSGGPRETFICFRGTHFLSEWAKDAEILPQVNYDHHPNSGKVHIGFHAVYETVRKSVLDAVKKSPGLPLTIVGHSLGSALATLCALDDDVASSSGTPPSVFPFASPRVGNEDFGKVFDQTLPVCIRIVNKPDIVPHVPLPIHYRHVGEAAVVDGGLTLDVAFNHGLCEGYLRGLNRVIAQPPTMHRSN